MPREVDDDPQPEDIARFGNETSKCPKCKAEIYDDAEWCHKCGAVLGGSDAPVAIKRWQIITAGVLLFIIVIYWNFR